MSIVHLNQIKNHILLKFKDTIPLDDLIGVHEHIDNQILSRSLSAFVISSISECTTIQAGFAVTDGGEDNGIDAIHVDPDTCTIYVVQSKWIHSGKGEPSNGDVKKFLSGIKDILNCNFSRFNSRIQEKEDQIVKAMQMPASRLVGCLAYTGVNSLAEPSRRDLGDFLNEVNDVSEYLNFKIINQSEIYKLLSNSIEGAPINIDIGLKNWGSVKHPSMAYYGQINGAELKHWWNEYGVKILKKNIRSGLGETDVNQEISQTIKRSPENFWFYNNGITLIAQKIKKTMVGGGDKDYGTFCCEGVSVVNGAQTLSTLGKFDSLNEEDFAKIFVHLRIISLENQDEAFGEKITKSNNLQNRIESRDFVSLDHEQQRLKQELSLENINYSIKRDSEFSASANAFDLFESTTALAVASNNPNIIVQLKREIGRIWDDTTKFPYTSIFHKGVTSTYLLRCVLINREIEKAIQISLGSASAEGSHYGVGIHGNRIIAGLVFSKLKKDALINPKKDLDKEITKEDIHNTTRSIHLGLASLIERLYSKAVLPTLFKNAKTCVEIYDFFSTPFTDTALVDSPAQTELPF